jgi:hypothetical protein
MLNIESGTKMDYIEIGSSLKILGDGKRQFENRKKLKEFRSSGASLKQVLFFSNLDLHINQFTGKLMLLISPSYSNSFSRASEIAYNCSL